MSSLASVPTLNLPALDDRLSRAWRHYSECHLCEHRCGANRLQGQRGPCKAGTVPWVFKQRIELGEEEELIPSLLFYLSGCDLRCAFCIAEANAFDPRGGRPLTRELFQQAVLKGKAEGARTIQWVGGEPTIHLPAILKVMAGGSGLPPVVWKSDFHATPEAMDLLDEAVDIYLADFKFGNDTCARRIAGVDSYMAIVTRNLRLAADRGYLIIRHLLLPGHLDCCFRPIMQWIKANLPDVKFSLRDGYTPSWQSFRFGELKRPLSPAEAARARELAIEAKLRLIT
ncbi:MAG: radical SAM protein [Isosphaeraceae bacterium]